MGQRMVFGIAFALTACASATTRQDVATAPPLSGKQTLVADRLVFGQSIPGGGHVADAAWKAFLREVVTPSFPAGLTVWHAEGQWLDPRGDVVREHVIVVEVFHRQGAPADSVFSRIAAEYRHRFHQDAVLRTTFEARTQLYEGSSGE